MSFRFGVDVLFDEREPYLQQLNGKRIGLITNPTGVDSALISVVERFRQCASLSLVALYGPEHGVRGNAQAGEFVEVCINMHVQSNNIICF
jgi:beta-N-acetylhexosaminidase